jgi:FAD/FMN-containing dehydrogenase
MDLIKNIKVAFDPKNILNPGKICWLYNISNRAQF